MKKILGNHLHLCIVALGDRVVSAGIYSECSGIVQGVLGGTRDEVLPLSPSSLETDYVRSWAKERGNEFLHLGGGVGGIQDSLYKFKSGFSRQRHSFMTLRLILDIEKYNYFLALRAKHLDLQREELLGKNYFPAYRGS